MRAGELRDAQDAPDDAPANQGATPMNTLSALGTMRLLSDGSKRQQKPRVRRKKQTYKALLTALQACQSTLYTNNFKRA